MAVPSNRRTGLRRCASSAMSSKPWASLNPADADAHDSTPCGNADITGMRSRAVLPEALMDRMAQHSPAAALLHKCSLRLLSVLSCAVTSQDFKSLLSGNACRTLLRLCRTASNQAQQHTVLSALEFFCGRSPFVEPPDAPLR